LHKAVFQIQLMSVFQQDVAPRNHPRAAALSAVIHRAIEHAATPAMTTMRHRQVQTMEFGVEKGRVLLNRREALGIMRGAPRIMKRDADAADDGFIVQ